MDTLGGQIERHIAKHAAQELRKITVGQCRQNVYLVLAEMSPEEDALDFVSSRMVAELAVEYARESQRHVPHHVEKRCKNFYIHHIRHI